MPSQANRGTTGLSRFHVLCRSRAARSAILLLVLALGLVLSVPARADDQPPPDIAADLPAGAVVLDARTGPLLGDGSEGWAVLLRTNDPEGPTRYVVDALLLLYARDQDGAWQRLAARREEGLNLPGLDLVPVDGRPAVFLTAAVGAHGSRMVALRWDGSAFATVLDTGSNAPALRLVNMEPDGSTQVRDDWSPYCGGYASSPRLPTIYAWDGSRFADATGRYPAVVRAAMQPFADLLASPPTEDPETRACWQEALAYGADLLGDSAAARTACLAALSLDPSSLADSCRRYDDPAARWSALLDATPPGRGGQPARAFRGTVRLLPRDLALFGQASEVKASASPGGDRYVVTLGRRQWTATGSTLVPEAQLEGALFDAQPRPYWPVCDGGRTYCSSAVGPDPAAPPTGETFTGLRSHGGLEAAASHVVCCNGPSWTVVWRAPGDPRATVYSLALMADTASAVGQPELAADNGPVAQQLADLGDLLQPVFATPLGASSPPAEDPTVGPVTRTTIERADALWAEAVGNPDVPLDRLSDVAAGAWLDDLRATIDDQRAQGLTRQATRTAPLDLLGARRISVYRVEADVQEHWSDRTYAADGSLAEEAPPVARYRYLLEAQDGVWKVVARTPI